MKTQNPIIGRAKGSAGGMTFSKNYDKNVARAKAFEVSNPKTTAQTTERNFFKQLTALTTDFSDAQLRTLFPAKPKTMSRRNALTKQIAEYYVVDGTTKSIDFANIDTLGNAPVMDFGTTICELSDDSINVILDNSVKANQQYALNHFIVALVNETKEQILVILDSDTVEIGELSMDMPTSWEDTDTIHAIPFITNSLNAVLPQGFGSFIVKVRPTNSTNNRGSRSLSSPTKQATAPKAVKPAIDVEPTNVEPQPTEAPTSEEENQVTE